MTLLNPAPGEIFTIRIYKRYQDTVWANTYEYRARLDNPPDYSELLQFANVLADRESDIHLEFVQYDKVVISTYAPDSRPYDPTTFVTIPVLGLFGKRGFGVEFDALPLGVCVYARFQASSGRPGKRFYRGCLIEPDVSFGTSSFTLASGRRAVIEGELNDMLTAALTFGDIVLASGQPNPTFIRPVVQVQVSPRVTVRKMDAAYFDRAPSAASGG